jgi:hypothetical protein
MAVVSWLRKAVSALVIVALCAGMAVFGIWLFDRSLPDQSPNSDDNFRQLVLHPYTGFHNVGVPVQEQASPDEVKRFKGDRSYRENEDTVRVLGFADSINVINPLPKPANEVRVIVIGGSGAQGQGDRRGAAAFTERFEAKLEQWINEKLNGTGWHTRFINMAMGGSISYQNFIQLNRWGRQLQPDAIISYSGRNDLWVPDLSKHDGYYWFDQVNYLVTLRDNLVRGDEPEFMQTLAKYLPRMYHDTLLPFYIKSVFFGDRYKSIAAQRYRAQLGYDEPLTRTRGHGHTIATIAVPQQAHALKSIKRDLLGIPIVLAWQHSSKEENDQVNLSEGSYDGMFEAVSEKVKGYCNDDWLFINTHAIIRDMNKPELGGAHLTGQGHAVLARVLLDPMSELVNRIIERRKAHRRPTLGCTEPQPEPFIPVVAEAEPTTFDNWIEFGVDVSGGVAAPDGSTKAAKISEHNGPGTKQVIAMGQVEAPKPIVARVHARYGKGRRLLLFTAAEGRSILSCDVDLQAGRTTVKADATTQAPTCNAVPQADGWWRVEMTGAPNLSNPDKLLLIGVSPTIAPFENNYDADGKGYIFAWGASISPE